jgi:hypothetical protein
VYFLEELKDGPFVALGENSDNCGFDLAHSGDGVALVEMVKDV